MLKFLRIHNFALAEALEIEFNPGLNILTGETGAGKSILVNAIAAVLGDRVYTEVIRTGSEKATVQAVFSVTQLPTVRKKLAEKGIECTDELFLRREILQKGSTRAFINDVPVPINTLSEIGDLLLDIHGQHSHQSLLRRETHRGLLDALGGLLSLLPTVAERYHRVAEITTRLNNLQNRQKELEQQYELYQFQHREIEAAALHPGEEAELLRERKRLANMEKLFDQSAHLRELFTEGEPDILSLIAEAERRLQELSQFSEELVKIYEEFSTARIVMEETARNVEEFSSRLEYDPRRLEEVEERLNLISKLKKKYGETIEAILAYQETIAQALQQKENFSLEMETLARERQQALTEYCEAAGELSERRHQAARAMEEQVEAQLRELGMPGTRFQVRIERSEDPEGIFEAEGVSYFGDADGIDQVEFFISPNPGEDFKPLAKIASGGEVSRIMLALKSILAEIDRVPTLVFDEIDSGVSGRIARAVGRSIHELSKSHQILCITHLPQIASYGTSHYSVEKYVENGRTFTRIIPLSDDQRVEEVARLLAGEQVSESARQSARQLIEEGKEQ